MLPFIIVGLVTGSVYGLAGVGLVLTYKTSGIFNLAYGALATVAAYLFYCPIRPAPLAVHPLRDHRCTRPGRRARLRLREVR